MNELIQHVKVVKITKAKFYMDKEYCLTQEEKDSTAFLGCLTRKKAKKVGTFVAVKKNDKVLVGWSKCRLAKDKFDPKRGTDIARERALTGSSVELPPSLDKPMIAFVDRVRRYFVDVEIMMPGHPKNS